MVLSYCADESRWLPIELTSPDDVEQLNELLSDGWRIERLDIEGLPFLAFCGRKSKTLLAERGASSRLLLILQRGSSASRAQRAVFIGRTDGGYIELGKSLEERTRPGFATIFPIGRDGVVSIVEV